MDQPTTPDLPAAPPLPSSAPLPVDLYFQPPLFNNDPHFASELLTIDEDRAAGKATATTLERRQEFCDLVLSRIAGGMSRREACRIFHIGGATLRALIRRAEASGKIDALKERLIVKFGHAAEL